MILTTQQQTGELSCCLSDVSPKDKPWDLHGLERDIVRDAYFLQGYLSHSQRMSDCSQQLDFILRSSDELSLVFKLKSAKFCRVRYCPVCQWRRSLKWRARFFEALPGFLEDHPRLKFIFLTLTVKNCALERLQLTVREMNKAWNKLVRRKQFPALGWLKSLEVTKSQDLEAHPHFHCLLVVPSDYFLDRSYISQSLWREWWRKSLKLNYDPVVNVKKVKPRFLTEEDPMGLMAAVCETLKYSVKPSNLIYDPGWLVGLTQQMHRVRAINVGGILKPYLSDLEKDSDTEDLVHIDSELTEEESKQAEVSFNWNSSIKRYVGS